MKVLIDDSCGKFYERPTSIKIGNQIITIETYVGDRLSGFPSYNLKVTTEEEYDDIGEGFGLE